MNPNIKPALHIPTGKEVFVALSQFGILWVNVHNGKTYEAEELKFK
jgi:hypothetical protein